ncbi:MAG: flagellar motor switch protein FliN [Sphingomonadaceae bacterium]|nr:flagellar motor switch protein FliN [Sphingomonadaceae bacterium]
MTFQSRGYEFLKDIDVRLSVELGRTDMKLKDVLALGEESVVLLDRLTDELLDVMVNGKPIAKGEIVTQGNRFGLRIVELASESAALPDVPVQTAQPLDLGQMASPPKPDAA